MNRNNNADKSTIFKVVLVLFLYSAAVLFVCIVFRPFAEFYSRTVSFCLRKVFSLVFGIVPFSVAEAVLLLFPIAFVVFIVAVLLKRCCLKKFFRIFVLILSIMAFLFVNLFGVCYLRNPIEYNMDFEVNTLARDDLLQGFDYISNNLISCADNIEYSVDYSSICPYNWKELNTLIDTGFDSLISDYPFISDINCITKPILLSEYMTYTHISGIYIPFTSEANVNTNYPQYVVAFTIAHEKAHQRGISGEDEANFIAFLACLYSNDNYLEYVAYMNMFDYFLDEIYRIYPNLYYEYIKSADTRILGEMYAYSVFFDKYRDSVASEIADSVNDVYLKSMGDSRGVESYSRVVELFISYLKNER